MHIAIGHNEVDVLVIVHHHKSLSHVVPCDKGDGRVAKSVYSVEGLYAFVPALSRCMPCNCAIRRHERAS